MQNASQKNFYLIVKKVITHKNPALFRVEDAEFEIGKVYFIIYTKFNFAQWYS